jgi:hypothetical protein
MGEAAAARRGAGRRSNLHEDATRYSNVTLCCAKQSVPV